MKPLTIISGGPPHPNLPLRYGCVCGAVWNSNRALDDGMTLCGPHCKPTLTLLREEAA